MLYFVVLTNRCNLHCSYCGCGGEGEESGAKAQYKIEDLKRFIMWDPEPSIIFYGGEPLVRSSRMKQIMDSIPVERYLLQTNALRLSDLEPRDLKRFDAILVSIDGRRETTDCYRGAGVYDEILDNLRAARQGGFRGDLVARMTASDQTDIFADVMHLLQIDDPKFDHVHWQIDALWDSPPEMRWNNFEKWISESYDPGIERLVKTWGDSMIKQRKVLPIVPFIGIMNTLLNGSKSSLRCGAGIDSFAIGTSGDLAVCPIAPEWSFAKVGSIYKSRPQDLPYKVQVGEPCSECDVLNICGGRCLFANKTKLWGESGFQRVCKSTRSLIGALAEFRQGITDLISGGLLSKKEFSYSPYNNGTEIIP